MSCLARRPGVPRLPERLSSGHPSRNVATNPTLSSTRSDTTTTFSSPSRPRPVHSRPLPKRDLPVMKVSFGSRVARRLAHTGTAGSLEPPTAIDRYWGTRTRRLGWVCVVRDKLGAGFRCGNAPSSGNCSKKPSNQRAYGRACSGRGKPLVVLDERVRGQRRWLDFWFCASARQACMSDGNTHHDLR